MAGLYIHIPFCAKRCTYCDFYSTLRADALANRYVDAIVAEARLRSDELQHVSTVYIGGGTPSLLTDAQWQRLTDGLQHAVDLSNVQEFTAEVNPDDVTPALADTLLHVGVNRVSMGVQSLNDNELRLIGRRHTARQAINAVTTLRRAGCSNLSIDLISGLPTQTLRSWQQSVEAVIALHPEHLSAYDLSYEHGTVLWQQWQRGEVQPADDETCRQMSTTLRHLAAQAGYRHYELSNYALPERESRHNSAYWDGTPYVGLGAGAHSFNGHHRSHHPAHIDNYLNAIEQGRLNLSVETLTDAQRYNEAVMLALRTAGGIALTALQATFGNNRADYLLRQAIPHLHHGTLLLHANRLTLAWTGPQSTQALMTANDIISDLMADTDNDYPRNGH